jgi:hypothetical protein
MRRMAGLLFAPSLPGIPSDLGQIANRWSSYPYSGAGDPDNRTTEHDVCGRLGRSRSQRAYRYRTLFTTALDQKAIHALYMRERLRIYHRPLLRTAFLIGEGKADRVMTPT